MSRERGTFIVIEGADGLNNDMHMHRLAARLRREGHPVATFDFPRQKEPSGYFVNQFVSGEYGTAEEVGTFTASLFYALDRYAAAKQIQAALDDGKIVISNRYTASSMGHLGTLLKNAEERRGYFIWLDNLEFTMLGIPRPDKNIVLRRAKKSTAGPTITAAMVYDDLVQLFPKDFTAIDCVRSGTAMNDTQIEDMLWKTVQPLLPEHPQTATQTDELAEEADITPDNPYVQHTTAGWRITEEGRQFLEGAITNTTGDVYGFTGKLNTMTVAAAMARLCRRGDDMRVTLLDEFVGKEKKEEQLFKRVITAYGDDSVQQLVGQHLVIENASNLLTKQIEWGRLAAYLEQSTRYIYFDQKDAQGRYKYYTPEHLTDLTKLKYTSTLDKVFEFYSAMVRSLTSYLRKHSTVPKSEQDASWRAATKAQACDTVRPVLPVATTSTVGVFASGQALESMIQRLMSSESLEAQRVGKQVLDEARKTIPSFLERTDKPDRGGAHIAYLSQTHQKVRELSQKYLSSTHSTVAEAAQLMSVWPRNELDLVPHMLYDTTDLSLQELQAEVASWPIDQKIEVFQAYMGERLNRRQKPGRALEQAHYTWDIICDYGIFRDLQRHRMVDDLRWQALTPRYGYEVPKLIEDAGLSDMYEACFDMSAKLYSALQQEGYEYEAQYATLLGHRMRWKVTYNAREAFHLHELRTSPQGHPGYRKLLLDMHEKLAEVHPMLAEAMKFVNKGEDPELTRLAAERYTAFKLDQTDASKP